jgi:hypothetical protein
MGLEDYKEVYNTTDCKEANKLLAAGWSIIKVISSKSPVTEQGDMAVLPMYILGRKVVGGV